MQQVELDIATAPHQLFLTVGLGPWLVEVGAHEMAVDDEEGAADILDEVEVGVPAAFVLARMQPVEEDAASAARLVAVG